ncbi:acyltransferase family protein [Microbulbifer sp. SSSA005]|uniref:acyltransferase family protein n=1 Tax=Microbulbifer sp. SSSA005 TaxID=3243378 RepID=UPI00403A37BD
MNKRFEALDAFRGIAALCVVIFHMRLIGSITELDFFRGSSIFVEFFFVLSGFVLAHGYGARKNLVLGEFMKSRFFRLYPLHLFMFFVFLLLEVGKLAAYKYGGFTFNTLPFTGRTAISEIIPNLLLIQSLSPTFEALSFNYPSWSISIEFYLYLLLFISIVVFKNFKSIIWCSTAVVALYLIASESEILTSQILRGLSCFFGGALIYLFYMRVANIRITKPLGTIAEVFVVACIVVIVQYEIKHQNIVATILFYFAILVFSFESGVVSSLLKQKPFQELGKLSYSIYMTHAAILFCFTSTLLILQKISGMELAPMLNGDRYLTLGNGFVNSLIVLVILGLVIFISSLTHRYIEVKWQRKGKARHPNSSEEWHNKALYRTGR